MSDTQLQSPRRVSWADDKLYHYQYIAFVFVFLSFHAVLGEPCNFDADPCICATKTFTLNLKSFMDARKGEDLLASGEVNNYTYYVQPCNRKLSNQIPNCIAINPDLISCQVFDKTKQAYGLGLKNIFDATQDQDNFILTNSFMGKPDNVNRTLHLTVKCSKQEQFTYEGSSTVPPLIYKFTLATSHVCSGGNNDGNKGGLSPGSIMVIIFFVLVIVYLLGGLLFQKFARKAQGVEIIPNYIFWTDLPFLVKDGVVFTFSCCKGSSGYDKI